MPTHPCALLVYPHKNPCHHPTCDQFPGAGHLPQRLGFHCDLRADISKKRHTVAKLRLQLCILYHTVESFKKVNIIKYHLKSMVQ